MQIMLLFYCFVVVVVVVCFVFLPSLACADSEDEEGAD